MGRDQSVSTVALRNAELWLHVGAALHAAGDATRAAEVLATGRRRLHDACTTQVAADQRDAFLYRNPVHRELLTLVARLVGP